MTDEPFDDEEPFDEEPFEDEDLEEEEPEQGQFDMNEMVSITPTNIDMVIDAMQSSFPMLEKEFFVKFAQSMLGQEVLFSSLMDKIENAMEQEVEKELGGLVKSGDVEMGIDEKNGRVVYWLTPQGTKQVDEIKKQTQQYIENLFDGIEPEEEEE